MSCRTQPSRTKSTAGFVPIDDHVSNGLHGLQAIVMSFAEAPGNFRERITQADLVVSGTIVSTVPSSTRVVDGVDLRSNQVSIEVDRVFKGRATDRTMHFVWFSPAPIKGGGVIYSGPPLAKFVAGQRFMVFLRKDARTYVVIMPVYRIEVPLAPASSRNVADVSLLPDEIRDSEIAEELESAALAIAPPAPGTTGLAATYFPYVVDLIGGCAQAFLQHFAASPSGELRRAAQGWLRLLADKNMRCEANRHFVGDPVGPDWLR